jgi:hypothetical protein
MSISFLALSDCGGGNKFALKLSDLQTGCDGAQTQTRSEKSLVSLVLCLLESSPVSQRGTRLNEQYN